MGEELDLCFSQGHQYEVKRRNSRPGFELGSLNPFPSTTLVLNLAHWPLVAYRTCYYLEATKLSTAQVYWYNRLNIRHWSGRSRFNARSSHTKDSKKVLDASLLNTQYYKVRIKGKWSNPRKRVASSPTPRCSSY